MRWCVRRPPPSIRSLSARSTSCWRPSCRRRSASEPEMDPFALRRLGRTGLELPRLGLGGAAFGNIFNVIPDSQASATMDAAWDAGVRFYDTSPWYGRGLSEHRIGQGL